MTTIKFLHTADWQLGKPFQRITDEAKRTRLQNERINCLRQIGNLARESGASFILVAGDLFDSTSPLKSTVAQACEAIGAMEIPVLAIPGNHDHAGPGSVWEQPFFVNERKRLAPNLRVLFEGKPVVLENAVVFPAPLLRRHDHTDPTAWIRTAFEATEFPPHLPCIVLAHGSVQGFDTTQEDEDEEARGLNRIDLDRLPISEIDYIALGDWHGTKRISEKAWYSGTPEIDRFPRGKWPSAFRTKSAIPWSAQPLKKGKTPHRNPQSYNRPHIPQHGLKDRLHLLQVPENTTRATSSPIPSPRSLESLPMPSKTSTTAWKSQAYAQTAQTLNRNRY